MEVSNKHDLLVPSPSHQGREPSATFMDSAEKQDEESAGHLKGLRLHFTTAACVIYWTRCAFRSNWQPASVCASFSPISKFLLSLQLLSVLPTTSADSIEVAGSSPPIFLDMLVRSLGRYKTSQYLADSHLGVLIIYAKLSDIFGRKSLLLLAVAVFVIFSGAW